MSNNHNLAARGFYFSELQVAPNDESRLYFLSFNIMLSEDGGKTARTTSQRVHVDHHTHVDRSPGSKPDDQWQRWRSLRELQMAHEAGVTWTIFPSSSFIWSRRTIQHPTISVAACRTTTAGVGHLTA